MAGRALQSLFHEEYKAECVDDPQSREYSPAVLRIIRPPSFMDTSFLNFDDISSDEEYNMEHYANPVILEGHKESSSENILKELSQDEKEDETQHSVFCSGVIFQAAIIVCYYGIGVLFYRFVEKWSVLDCIYFTTVSMTTVGYGDVTPATAGGKLFTIFYVLFGLVYVMGVLIDGTKHVMTRIEQQVVHCDGKSLPWKTIKLRRIALATVMAMCCIAIGAAFICKNEGWSVVTGIYWTIITTTGVGYGDLNFEKKTSRMFNVAYVLCSVIIVAYSFHIFFDIQNAEKEMKRRNDMLQRPLTAQFLMSQASEGGDGIDRLQFLVAMLVHAHGFDKDKDITPWLERFDELDADGSGALDKEDLEMFAAQEAFRKREETRRLEKQFEKRSVRGVVKDAVLERAKSLRMLLVPADSDSDSSSEDSAVEAATQEAAAPRQLGDPPALLTSLSPKSPSSQHELKPSRAKDERYLKFMMRRFKRKFGTSDSRTLGFLNNLGVLYYKKHLYPLAEKCFQLCYSERLKSLGAYHENTVDSMYNLGTVLAHIGQGQEALALFESCLRTREKFFGDYHEETLAVVNNMAWVYSDLQEESFAIGLYEYLLRVRIQLAEEAKSQQSNKEAAIDSKLAYVMDPKGGSVEPPRRRSSMLLRTLTKDTDFAFPDNTANTGVTERDHIRTCNVNVLRARFNLALCNIEFSHFDTAIELLDECRVLSSELFGVSHRATVRVNKCLVDAQSRQMFSSQKCRVMRNYYSNDALVQRVDIEREKRGTGDCGGLVSDPDRWIDEALAAKPYAGSHNLETFVASRRKIQSDLARDSLGGGWRVKR